MDAWRAEAQGMLSDALQTLRTFDIWAAYRVSITPGSGQRLPASLTWDPPTDAAWDMAMHVSRSLHGRAEQLFRAIIGASIESSLWREQRAMADSAHDAIGLGDALLAYYERIDRLPPGDASGALDLLDRAWTQWETVAARWGLSRSEPIGCGV
jgi:hypothetical protein